MYHNTIITRNIITQNLTAALIQSFTHQQTMVFDNAKLFGPLAKPFLPPQESADVSIFHQLNRRLC